MAKTVLICRKVMIMQTNDFEKAFSDYIDRREYDEAHSALFRMVRISFEAGWKAAGGEPPQPHKIFELVKPEKADTEPEKE